ncbi:hypothetical protein [Methyloceanibacter sp.]|uniref:hypothetical protein n=1 Tax=Methyloceanibacter sp. TaxID=1965321 RepID=UPI002BF902C9|nr:hypothetical protein [Methyloceanibacter sp.]HML93403.1 hypothetical protein [Methyloceanibacter sp.]
MLDTVGAAFRQENLIASAIDGYRPAFKEDPEHDPLDLIRDTHYERDHLDSFVGSRNADETRFIMGRIDREKRDRETLAGSGGFGIAAGVAAGVLDPTVLLPLGPAVKGARGMQVAKSAATSAAAVGGAVAVQEAGLQATQELRTGTESAIAIGTGTLLGGLLGGALSTLGKAEVSALTAKLDGVRASLAENPDFIPVERSAGAAAVGVRGPAELEGTAGMDKVTGFMSPVTRLQTSQFSAARNTVRDIADAGLSLKENRMGVPTSLGGTVENRVKMWQGGLADAITTQDDAYSRYWFGASKTGGRQRARIGSEWARWSGNTGGKLTAKEFREEVGRAMARNDTHPIAEVAETAKAYRAKVFDPLKNAAIRAKVLDENVKAVGADSYIMRVYRRDRIIAERDRFSTILFDHFKNRSGGTDMPDAEIRALVDDTIDTITGNSPFRIPGLDMVQGERGPLKARVLNIPDEKIEDFLERDVEIVSQLYTRTMSADVELAQKFGDVRLEEPLAKLRDEFDAAIGNATTRTERESLQSQYSDAVRDIEALRDRIRHTYALPDNIEGLPYRAGKIAQQLNYLRLLGGMTVSAIPDLWRPVMTHGLTSTFRDGWIPLVRNFGTARLAGMEVKRAGAALDMVLDTRARSIADLFDDWQRGSKLERGLESATSRFGLVSLMAPWNAAIKQVVGTMTMNQVLRAAEAVSRGKASAKQIKNLAADGIDEALAKRIWGEFNGNGGTVKDGLYLPNTEDWADRKAVEAFRAAIIRETDRTVVTPGLELPLWISTPLGRVLGQFKSFQLSTTQRVLMAGLQQKDAAFITGMVGMIGLGALTAHVKASMLGIDTSKWDTAKWGVEAVDRSGLLSVFSEVNNIAEKVTRGRVGLSAITGEMASRYQSRTAVGALLGPTFDLATEGVSAVGSAFAGEWSASDTRALRKTLPYQNVFYVRKLLDEVEGGFNSALGVKAKR